MSTNRPNPNQHNNRPNQQHPPAVIPKTLDEPAIVPKTLEEPAIVPKTIEKPVFTEKALIVINTEASMTFKELLAHLFTEVLYGNISAQQSRNQMRNWYYKLPSSDQVAFRAARNENDEALNMLKGIVETLAQEVPFMYVD